MTAEELEQVKQLVRSTGMNYAALGNLLDVDERSLLRWLSGSRKPRHPAMLIKALQMIVLEQRGIITKRLVETIEMR